MLTDLILSREQVQFISFIAGLSTLLALAVLFVTKKDARLYLIGLFVYVVHLCVFYGVILATHPSPIDERFTNWSTTLRLQGIITIGLGAWAFATVEIYKLVKERHKGK